MALTPGTRLGPFELVSILGSGGNGEVYKARDTRLNRTVAIKVLKADVAADAGARARFEREARAIAALSHPHICTIHDVGLEGDTDYLVMEYLEGETLAERLAKAKGPLPLEQVLSIGVAVADALDKAHRAGITHRDLKPANVMLTKTGPKLLDFGLAKLRGAASPVVSLMDPSGDAGTTAVGPATAKGTILGTIHYMAPEQVEGREADTRSDIWALGALFYEMATGQRPFDGESAASVIGAILKDTPPAIATRQPLTPSSLERLVKKCLKKEADERWQSTKDLHDELQWIRDTAVNAATHPSQSEPRRRERAAWILVVAAVLAAAALALPAMRYVRGASPLEPLETRVDIVTPATDQPTSFALAPDGRQIVFVASGDGASRLWLRSLTTTVAQPLPGTEGATYPFWSPDSRSIGFFALGALMRLDLGGGTAQTLAPAFYGRGGTWNADGVIVFAPSGTTPLMRVAATGGAAATVTTLAPQQQSHEVPYFLPDGRRFLFFVRGPSNTAGIYTGTIDGSVPTRLTSGDRDRPGGYLPGRLWRAQAPGDGGWLLWVRGGTLLAQRLDLGQALLVGEPMTLSDGLETDRAFQASAVSVAATGLVAYRAGAGRQRQLTWMDRSGMAHGTVGEPDPTFIAPRVAPDGRRVVVARTVRGNEDVWMLDDARMTRLTFDTERDDRPLWSPDGTRIAFRSRRTGGGGGGDLYQRLASGAGEEERLLTSDQNKTPASWSPDGRFLLYSNTDARTGVDIWVLPMVGDHSPSVFLTTPFREIASAFSPDGRWLAYHSNESGRNEVYVRPFILAAPAAPGAGADRNGRLQPETRGQWQVSTAGGIHPTWRPDGKALYYLNPAGAMMAAQVMATGATLDPGSPVVLFQTGVWGGGVDIQQGRNYDVAPDGRFLINTELDSAAAPITLLQNWNPEAKK